MTQINHSEGALILSVIARNIVTKQSFWNEDCFAALAMTQINHSEGGLILSVIARNIVTKQSLFLVIARRFRPTKQSLFLVIARNNVTKQSLLE